MDDGKAVYLRGLAIGGWLNTENFINGYSGNESSWLKALREELGQDVAEAFTQAIRDHFFTEEDVAYIRSLGATAIRLPFHWRYTLGENLSYIDRAIAWAKQQGLYVILDFHAAPGWQNPGWHSDNPYGVALFWHEPHYQEQLIIMWQVLADRYRDEPTVAGYDLLNEPYAPENETVVAFFGRLISAVREVDRRHILFIEGNRYAQDFAGFERLLEQDDQIVFSSHNYMAPTHLGGRFPGWLEVEGRRTWIDPAWVESYYLERNRWFLERNLPCYVGEFGALYDAPYETPSLGDLARLAALDVQMSVFNRYGTHWTLWTYKDLGTQGVRVLDPSSRYSRYLAPFLTIKRRLGVDEWTARSKGPVANGIRNLIMQIEAEIIEHFRDYAFPTRSLEEVLLLSTLYGHIANALNPYFARAFAGLSAAEVYEVVKEGVRFEHTKERRVLAEVLRKRLTNLS
ncbi:glycoside hydrolase family 5 protein [Thermus brockianus]|uniref:glycoside hydrolase family 5 protein n=1 Tax=Thermus brockianus TaxID=56956 RepID=UPI001FCB6CE8|nr:cellulase family glycosylhydrolase [Thermus brockianus]